MKLLNKILSRDMLNNEVETVHKLAVFKGKQIRRLIHNDEWWFSVIDVVGALTDSDNPRD